MSQHLRHFNIVKNIYTLIILLLLTIATAFASRHGQAYNLAILLILVLSGIKFLLVAFQFMELKKAHPFWKTFLIIFLLAFISIISLMLEVV